MHEMSVAMAVVEQVEEAAARTPGAAAVASVRLRIGELAGVVDDALRFSFELACQGTVLEGAELATETVRGRARCGGCGTEWWTGMPPVLCCAACGGVACELLTGRELEIADVRWAESPAASLAGEESCP